MIPSEGLTQTLLIAAAAVLAGVWVTIRLILWRRKTPAELERLRRLDVNRRGRIATALILDILEPELSEPGPRLLIYKYTLAGVIYEASQDISGLPDIIPLARRVTGRTTNLKYDPKRPSNSIIVCEHWSGLPEWNTGSGGAEDSVEERALRNVD